MPRYSEERKAALLKTMLPSLRLSAAKVARREGCSDMSLHYWRKQAAYDRVPGSGVTEPAEGALQAKEDGHRGSWLTLSLRRPNTHQRNHDDQAHYRIDRVG
ncbi:transposase [Pseudomonas putida]|nr:transposase [Pseudomonas putida]MDD2000058.1 transposase [Pseudomonas putida]HDS1789252.1 transposase [Pseudomonas putida]